jgi:hypothetical protein
MIFYVYHDKRIKFKYKGGGKSVNGSFFNEDLSLHEAGVAEGVHKVVGVYRARVDGVFHRWCFHKVARVAG